MLLYYVKCPIFIKKNYEPCQKKQESLTCTQGKRQSMETDWVGQEVGFSKKAFKAVYKIIQRTQGNCVLNIKSK